MTSNDPIRTVTITRKQEIFFSWSSDVLIYTIVLNLFVEYVDAVVIDSFTISIFTAVLLKVLLDIVMHFEHRVRGYFAGKEGAFYRVAGTLSLIGILFLGKLLILEVVDLVFGDHVELGHFIEVVALVLALMITRGLWGMLFKARGVPGEEESLEGPEV